METLVMQKSSMVPTPRSRALLIGVALVVQAAFLVARIAAAAAVQLPAPLFVDPGASPGGTGVSWQAAFNSLDTALSSVATDGTLFLKAGTYTPTNTSTGFHVIDRVRIYG